MEQNDLDKNTLFNRTFDGLKWSYISVGIVGVLQVIYTGVMARLLLPTDFGLLAMANLILRFGVYFARMGIGPAIIQKKEITKEDISIAFTSSMIFGLLITVIIFVLAPLANFILNNSEVIPIIRALSFSMLISSVSITATHLLRREFRFRSIAKAEVISFVFGAIFIGIPLAIIGLGVWSLVISTLMQGIFLSAASYFYSRHSLQINFHFTKYRKILGFGTQFSIINFIEFINANLDTLIVGRALGSDRLGIYNRANYLINIPAQYISTSVNKVMFSTFSEIQTEKVKLKEAYLSSLFLLGLFLFSFGFAISASAREITMIILGNNWSDAIPVLKIASLAMPFCLLRSLMGVLFDSTAVLKKKLILTIYRLIIICLLYYLLFPYGLVGFIFAFFIAELVFYFIFGLNANNILAIPKKEFNHINLIVIGFGLLVFVCVSIVTMIFTNTGASLILTFLAQVTTAGIILFIYVYIKPPGILLSIIRKYSTRIKQEALPPYVHKYYQFLVKHYQGIQ